MIWTDKDFFKIFTVPLLAGNPETALAEPNSIAISKKIADKFFPNEEALGQTLILDNKLNMKITAVFEVPSDWDGFRFHGYCIPSAEEIAKFRNEQVVQ